MTALRNWNKPFDLLKSPLGIAILAAASVLAVYAYLGLFSRYLADDYCNAALFASEDVFGQLITRYLEKSDRYTNIWFIGLSERLGFHSVTYLPAVMLALWVLGLTWLFAEIRRTGGWDWPAPVDLFLAAMLAFYALFQAPNLYQTLYWRASMSTHFAPLVFMAHLGAFLLRRIRQATCGQMDRWSGPLSFLLAFLVGGFSEPTVAIQIAALSIAILAIILLRGDRMARPALTLLSWTLAGSLAALLVMALSPANAFRLQGNSPTYLSVFERTLRYTVEFIRDTFQTLPLPTLTSVATMWLLFSGLSLRGGWQPSPRGRRALWLTAAAAPLIAYLLIAASFAPSAYGQAYPVERVRFAGRLLLTACLMLEGALFGVLAAQVRIRIIRPATLAAMIAFSLVLSALYPLRAAWLAAAEIPEYRARAAAWDARDAEIRALIAQGVTDLTVRHLGGVEGIKELDVRPRHWVNRCAAMYYRVNSIRAIPFR